MEATIGQDSWKLATINNIKLARNVVQRNDTCNYLGKQLDPLPSLRDNCIQNNNAKIHSYMRSTRSVVMSLRDKLFHTEEVIKSFLKNKESLEKSLDHIRKDLVMNDQSMYKRNLKPLRERTFQNMSVSHHDETRTILKLKLELMDGGDDLLAAEKRTLLKLKRILESQLRSVQNQLHILDNTRKRLKAVINERNRVLDFKVCDNRSVTTSKGKSKTKEIRISPESYEVHPLGPYTPEVAQAVLMATEAIKGAESLLVEVEEAINEGKEIQKDIHQSVNDGLTKRVAESTTMKQHLHLAAGANRMAINRSNRWRYATNIARNFNLGPVSSSDMTTRERLDRPHVRCVQRHPGTQIDEAQELIEANQELDGSLDSINRNLGMLNIVEKRLKEDIHDKRVGAQMDSSIVRERRSKANHRWVVGGVGC